MSFETLKQYSSLIFPQRESGVMVKEVVRFEPPADPFRALNEASKRIAEGKSVFESVEALTFG